MPIDRIETKGTILLGFALVAAQFMLAQVGIRTGWLIATLSSYVVAFGAGLIVIVPYRHDYPPGPPSPVPRVRRSHRGGGS